MAKLQAPSDRSEPVVVVLGEDGTVAEQFMAGRIRRIDDVRDQLHYGADYFCGDILAEATAVHRCVGFSHHRRISGSSQREPVWRWETTHIIGRRFKVGRKGILKEAS